MLKVCLANTARSPENLDTLIKTDLKATLQLIKVRILQIKWMTDRPNGFDRILISRNLQDMTSVAYERQGEAESDINLNSSRNLVLN